MFIQGGVFGRDSRVAMVVFSRRLKALVVLYHQKIRETDLDVKLYWTRTDGAYKELVVHIASPGKGRAADGPIPTFEASEPIVIVEASLPLPREILSCTRKCSQSDCVALVEDQIDVPLKAMRTELMGAIDAVCSEMIQGRMSVHKFISATETCKQLASEVPGPLADALIQELQASITFGQTAGDVVVRHCVSGWIDVVVPDVS